jgi:hypothetical protein
MDKYNKMDSIRYDMNKNMIYETLQKLIESQRKQPMETYLDEADGKIKSRPLSNQDSAGAYLSHKKVNEAKLIHQLIFGYYFNYCRVVSIGPVVVFTALFPLLVIR